MTLSKGLQLGQQLKHSPTTPLYIVSSHRLMMKGNYKRIWIIYISGPFKTISLSTPKKSIQIRLSSKRHIFTPLLPYQLDGTDIPTEITTKYLGVQIDRSLQWKGHTRQLVSKVNKRVRYIRALFPYGNQRARITLFRSLAVPVLDYCSTAFFPRQKSQIDELEGSVKRFLRTIRLGTPSDATSEEIHRSQLAQLGWESLALRRVKLALILGYKLIFKVLPFGELFFQEYAPASSSENVSRNTRHTQNILGHYHPVQPVQKYFQGRKIKISENSFTSLVCKFWNNLSLDDIAYSSITAFKTALDMIIWKDVTTFKEFPYFTTYL